MTASNKMHLHRFGVIACGLALRLFFIWRFPSSEAGDTPTYVGLARNWLDHGVYGLFINGRLTPVDVRMPGYPAFLAGMFALFGRSARSVMLAQAALDMVTCLLIAALAAFVSPEGSRRRVWTAALWLAALCPFTANYSAALLTESLALFFTSAALVILLFPGGLVDLPGHDSFFKVNEMSTLGAVFVGLGTLVRPETPLIVIATGLAVAARCWHPANWSKAIRVGFWMALGVILPLVPWAARNWHSLHETQFLAPYYAELPGGYPPRGFYAWTRTWLWRFGDVYLVPWKWEEERIELDDVPAAAFESPEERERVGHLLDEYNEELVDEPELDAQFAELARERTARHPLRTYFSIPLKRAFAMWFTPRTELLPYSGHLWPPGQQWEDDPVDFSVTAGLGLLNLVYVGLGAAGAWLARRRPAAAFLIAFILVRTAFFTHVETPEPRYMLLCFPALIALAAQLWTRKSASQNH